MNGQASLRLDALRAVAAFSVFCSHFVQLGVAGTEPETLWGVGRIGVIAFFVMSGYVIAYVAEHKHSCLRSYFEARLARLYSVFIPALALTIVLDALGNNMNPALYRTYPHPDSSRGMLYIPFFLTFMFENSLFSLRWFSNGPMWSIAYEFWYYTLFGLATYLRGSSRTLLMVGAILLTGWKVLLLAPVWISGVIIYRNRAAIAGWFDSFRNALFWGSCICLIILQTKTAETMLSLFRNWGVGHLPAGFHSYFLYDYLLSIPVIVLVATLTSTQRSAEPGPKWKHVAGRFAGFSFSLYLFHVPLIVFIRSTGVYNATSPAACAAVACSLVLVCYLLSIVTERRKKTWFGVARIVCSMMTTGNKGIEKHV